MSHWWPLVRDPDIARARSQPEKRYIYQRSETLCYIALHKSARSFFLPVMPIDIKGIEYLTLSDLLSELNVSRQTLWRWRQEGSIPGGQRYRGRQLIFTHADANEIRAFAERIEPVEAGGNAQLPLFRGGN